MKIKDKKIGIIISIVSILLIPFCIIFLYRVGNSEGITIEAFPIDICNGEDELFFVGKIFNNDLSYTYNLYKVDKNNYAINMFNFLENQEKCKIKKIASWDNFLFLIMAKTENEDQYGIWKINNKGECIFIYDLSSNIDISINDIVAFCIDGNGTCYFRSAKETILIDTMSNDIIRFVDTDENMSFESMVVGKNGKVYQLFCKSVKVGGGYEIIEISDKQMDMVYCGDLLPYDDIYSVLGTGNDKYDFFIKGSKNVYGFSKDEQKANYITKLSLDEYQYTKSCFIDGEKLLIFGINVKKVHGKKFNHTNFIEIDLLTTETTK